MPTRVAMGRLDEITGGIDQFGLYVTGPDGTTIIDGTSNMFKIIAVGDISFTASASTMIGETSITLTGLGTFASVPAVLGFVAVSANNTEPRSGSDQQSDSGSVKFAALTSGGSPTSPSGTFDVACRIASELDGTDQVVIVFRVSNATTGTPTRFAKYYVLQETAN